MDKWANHKRGYVNEGKEVVMSKVVRDWSLLVCYMLKSSGKYFRIVKWNQVKQGIS